MHIKLSETMNKVAGKIQDKGGRNPCHLGVTMVDNVYNCGKSMQYILLEGLDNPIEIEIDSELGIDNAMKESFASANSLYENTKLKQVKNEVVDDLRNELKTIVENEFKKSCHEISRHKQNNDITL